MNFIEKTLENHQFHGQIHQEFTLEFTLEIKLMNSPQIHRGEAEQPAIQRPVIVVAQKSLFMSWTTNQPSMVSGHGWLVVSRPSLGH